MVLSMAPVEKLLQPVHSSFTTGSLVTPCAPCVAQRTTRLHRQRTNGDNNATHTCEQQAQPKKCGVRCTVEKRGGRQQAATPPYPTPLSTSHPSTFPHLVPSLLTAIRLRAATTVTVSWLGGRREAWRTRPGSPPALAPAPAPAPAPLAVVSVPIIATSRG
jgi:hypothetical protein